MGIFDPAWLKLHHRICDDYEELAFKDHEANPDEEIDIQSVVSRVLEKRLQLKSDEARTITDQLYASFLDFPVRSAFEESLRKQKPDMSDQGVTDVFLAAKAKFLDTSHEHIYFVYFVVSYLIASGDFGITRGDYLIKICLGYVPDEKSITKLLKRTWRFASFLAAENR